MDISAIDKNFSFESTIDREGLVYHDVRKPPFRFYGLHEPLNATRPFHRLPEDVAEATSPGVKVLNFHTAGGRLTFSTNSPFIVIRCETAGNICPMAHMALSGSQGFDLYRMDDDGKITFHNAFGSPCNSFYRLVDHDPSTNVIGYFEQNGDDQNVDKRYLCGFRNVFGGIDQFHFD